MVSGKVLKERQRLAEEGIITVAAAVDWNGSNDEAGNSARCGDIANRSLLQKWCKIRLNKSCDRWSALPNLCIWGTSRGRLGWQVQLERELQRSMS